MFNNPLKALKRQNTVQLKQLSSNDQKLVSNTIKRLSVVRINSFQTQMIQSDLIGMALEYQLRGTSLEKELGSDPLSFANEIYSSAKTSN